MTYVCFWYYTTKQPATNPTTPVPFENKYLAVFYYDDDLNVHQCWMVPGTYKDL